MHLKGFNFLLGEEGCSMPQEHDTRTGKMTVSKKLKSIMFIQGGLSSMGKTKCTSCFFVCSVQFFAIPVQFAKNKQVKLLPEMYYVQHAMGTVVKKIGQLDTQSRVVHDIAIQTKFSGDALSCIHGLKVSMCWLPMALHS